METKTVKGDLKGAIRQYEKVAQGNDRAIAAKALVRMAGCYTKLGDAQAEKVYRKVLREFADQTQSSDEAREALAALGGAGTSDKLAERRLCAGCDIDEEANIKP